MSKRLIELSENPASVFSHFSYSLPFSGKMIEFQLLLIANTPIVRLGLRAVCEQDSGLQVVAEASTEAEALQILQASIPIPALAILDWDDGLSTGEARTGVTVCRHLKRQFPNLRVLILGGSSSLRPLEMARQAGASGYCPSGLAVEELIAIIRQVAAGQSFWSGSLRQGEEVVPEAEIVRKEVTSLTPGPRQLLTDLCGSGLQQIDATLAEVKVALQNPRLQESENLLAILDLIVLSGRRRELLAARWLVSQLLPDRMPQVREDSKAERPGENLPVEKTSTPLVPSPSQLPIPQPQVSFAAPTFQSTLFDATATKLQSALVNLTSVPLEVDIFRTPKKRELMAVILRQLELLLEDLRFSQIQLEQLPEKREIILQDLWQASITDFFGKYYTVKLGEKNLTNAGSTRLTERETSLANGENSAFMLPATSPLVLEGQAAIEVVPVLLQEATVVQREILDKIPLVPEFLGYLLFQTPLIVDNTVYPAESPEAMQRASLLLENLVIQVANSVVQPLLNNFADLEEIKQKFYDQQLITTREIEKFRNNLSWKYRLDNYVLEPKAIFESRFNLWGLTERGIQLTSIYAPRNQELSRLSGVPLIVTLVLEIRDALAPRVRASVAFLGTGIVYLLTQVIGRGIGLIGRGILQGIGNSLQDGRLERKSNR